MKRRIIFATVFMIILSGASPVAAQIAGRYYPETGHLLDAVFVNHYDAQGGPAVLGFPITDGRRARPTAPRSSFAGIASRFRLWLPV